MTMPLRDPICLLALSTLTACATPLPGTVAPPDRDVPSAVAELRAARAAAGDVAPYATASAPRVARTTVPRRRFASKVMIFDVQDLLYAPPSFAAPEFNVQPSGSTFEIPEQPERVRSLEPEMLIDAIRAAVAPGTWDDEGNSIDIVDGKLFVTRR